MNVQDGWRFYSADFSVQANSYVPMTGWVMLMRSPSEKAKWHKMPEKMKDDDNGPPLYVVGRGLTIEDAIISANQLAANAKPIEKENRGENKK